MGTPSAVILCLRVRIWSCCTSGRALPRQTGYAEMIRPWLARRPLRQTRLRLLHTNPQPTGYQTSSSVASRGGAVEYVHVIWRGSVSDHRRRVLEGNSYGYGLYLVKCSPWIRGTCICQTREHRPASLCRSRVSCSVGSVVAPGLQSVGFQNLQVSPLVGPEDPTRPERQPLQLNDAHFEQQREFL